MLDTSATTRDEAVRAVLRLLISGGWLAGAPERAPAQKDGPAAADPGAGAPAPMIRLGPTIRRI